MAAAAAAALLGRVGAAGLAGDVAALGERLLGLCAVNEAVHGHLYEGLLAELEEQRERQEAEERERAAAREHEARLGAGAERQEGQAVVVGQVNGEEEEEKLGEGDEI